MLIMMSLNARCSINTVKFVVVVVLIMMSLNARCSINTVKFVVVADVHNDVTECTLLYKHSKVCCGS